MTIKNSALIGWALFADFARFRSWHLFLQILQANSTALLYNGTKW